MDNQHKYGVLIIGSGAAGLSLALKLGEITNVAVLSKDKLIEGATLYAQGGISAVLNDDDSIDSHLQDTMEAGAGLCDAAIVKYVVERGQKSIDWLVDIGVNFTLDEHADGHTPFHLNREGGHSHRRIIHAADSTGRAIETTLETKVKQHPNITLLEYHTAIDLIIGGDTGDSQRCLGAYVFDQQQDCVKAIRSCIVVLATGGAGKVYLYTSNPDSCTGDGIAMAWRAGCRIANMEFIQFHPTCLYHPQAKSFLISEALRGEGARLILADGRRFMQHFDSREELAPRDIVARAIDHEMKRTGDECVYLDISYKSKDFITSRFPTILQRCLELGIDISNEPIPVVPAAHYTCGGIHIDKSGRTDLFGLYAIGEVSHTGLHGANRMASNSLLECIVFAHSAYKHIQQTLADIDMPDELPPWDESQVTDSDEEVVVSHNWDEIRRFMSDYVGIVRSNKRLQRAWHRIQLLQTEIHEYYGHFRISKDLVELRNIAQVAALIIHSAMTRKESRGLHYSLDYPAIGKAQNTVLRLKKNGNGHIASYKETIGS